MEEQGLVTSQQTAVDSSVFPIVLQPHFEGRLLWINAVGRFKVYNGAL